MTTTTEKIDALLAKADSSTFPEEALSFRQGALRLWKEQYRAEQAAKPQWTAEAIEWDELYRAGRFAEAEQVADEAAEKYRRQPARSAPSVAPSRQQYRFKCSFGSVVLLVLVSLIVTGLGYTAHIYGNPGGLSLLLWSVIICWGGLTLRTFFRKIRY